MNLLSDFGDEEDLEINEQNSNKEIMSSFNQLNTFKSSELEDNQFKYQEIQNDIKNEELYANESQMMNRPKMFNFVKQHTFNQAHL